MATNLYVAEDGTIHRNQVAVANGTANRNNAYNHCSVGGTNTQSSATQQVSMERIVFFWIISIFISILIGLGANEFVDLNFVANEGDFLTDIAPYVVMVGSLTGSILYGIFCANKVDYNLWAYVLSSLSAIGGIIGAALAVVIIYVLVVLVLAILAIAFVVGVICAMFGGS